jgi:MFS family permease
MSAKEAIIYTSEFLTSLSFTILASFYPGIAESKGIPIWMIGLIFSVDPILGLPTSILSGKYMNRFGRKKILTIGLFLGGLGTGLIGMIEFGSRNQTILISLISRLLAGIGAGMSMTASSAILVIDYPKEIDRVIGWFEAASGLGLLLGPIVGSLLNLYNISVTFSIFGLGFVGFAGYVQRYLDHDKTVVEDTKGLPLVKLISKPVTAN